MVSRKSLRESQLGYLVSISVIALTACFDSFHCPRTLNGAIDRILDSNIIVWFIFEASGRCVSILCESRIIEIEN